MISNAATAVLSGASLGLSGGLTPGPLLALVIAQTLAHSAREGVRVALAPLVTDLPMLGLALLCLSVVPANGPVLALISCCGAVFLAWHGLGALRWKGPAAAGEGARPASLRKGVLANLLNPSPYVFWFTVGAPLVLQARAAGLNVAAAFMLAFFSALVGSKITVALLAGRFSHLLGSAGYRLTMRGLGLMLLVYAALFARSALVTFF